MKKILQIFLILGILFLIGCGGTNPDSDMNRPEQADTIIAEESGIPAAEQEINTNNNSNPESGEDEDEGSADNGSENKSNKNDEQKPDRYRTSPTPEGKPAPAEPQDADIDPKTKYHCTLSITCATILDNQDSFSKTKLEVLPEDGIIYTKKEAVFYEGESVFDVLLRETKENKIHMEFVATPVYNSNYIEGINNIYEFDCGELSGWMYKVNGWFPNYGCSRYCLQDGDKIEWVYTCDLGRDVGGDWNAQYQKEEQ